MLSKTSLNFHLVIYIYKNTHIATVIDGPGNVTCASMRKLGYYSAKNINRRFEVSTCRQVSWPTSIAPTSKLLKTEPNRYQHLLKDDRRCYCLHVSSIAELRCFAVSVGAGHIDSTDCVVGFEVQTKRLWVSWGEWPQLWQLLRAVGSILFMNWPRIPLWLVGSCASVDHVFLGNVCSAVAMGGARLISSHDELLSLAVMTASWWMLLNTDL